MKICGAEHFFPKPFLRFVFVGDFFKDPTMVNHHEKAHHSGNYDLFQPPNKQVKDAEQ